MSYIPGLSGVFLMIGLGLWFTEKNATEVKNLSHHITGMRYPHNIIDVKFNPLVKLGFSIEKSLFFVFSYFSFGSESAV